MNKNLWPSFSFALIAFCVALFIGLKSPKDTRQGIAWISIESPQIRSISLESAERKTELMPLGIALAWIKTFDKGAVKEEFLAAEGVRDILFSLSPLWANRVIGSPAEAKLGEYGLAKDFRSLSVDLLGGGRHQFQIGSRGFQSFDYFVRDPAKNKVFLWNRDTVDQLTNPSQIAMRELRFLRPDDLSAIRVESNQKENKDFLLTKAQRIWKEGPKPLAVDDPRIEWMAKLSKVAIRSYRKKTSDEFKVLFQIQVEAETDWKLRFLLDEKNQVFILDPGNDRPDILLDSRSFASLYEEWKAGKVAALSE